MEHQHHHPTDDHTPHGPQGSLNALALSATVHCLSGCAIGEVAGMVLGTAFGWSNMATVVTSIILAFFTGYTLTMLPLLRAKLPFASAWRLALASDTASIAIMEVVDNLIMLVIPGAMNAGLSNLLFWVSLLLSLVLGGIAAFPVNRWLIGQGRGHAVVHAYHGHHQPHGACAATPVGDERGERGDGETK